MSSLNTERNGARAHVRWLLGLAEMNITPFILRNNLVKLDLDSDLALLNFVDRFHIINDILSLTPVHVDIDESSTAGHSHVRIEFLEPLEPLLACAVQAILGSDPVREAFNLRRIRRGQKNWNILFTEKGKK